MKKLAMDRCEDVNGYTLVQERDCMLYHKAQKHKKADQAVSLTHLHKAVCRGYVWIETNSWSVDHQWASSNDP